MATVVIYGASDDLVEVEGSIEGADEYSAYGEWVGKLEAPNGTALIVRAEFSPAGSEVEWLLSVENTRSHPGWAIKFGDRPGREDDPALIIEVPEGTRLVVAPEDDE